MSRSTRDTECKETLQDGAVATLLTIGSVRKSLHASGLLRVNAGMTHGPHLDGLADGQGPGPVGLPRWHAAGDRQALRGIPEQPREVLPRAHRRWRRRERALMQSNTRSIDARLGSGSAR